MNIITKCPCCGEEHPVHLTREQSFRYKKYLDGKGHIQDLLPDLTAEDREMLITGICPECWKKLEEDEDE